MQNIPSSYLEYSSIWFSFANRYKIADQRKVLSFTALHYNAGFQYFIAKNIDAIELYYGQHGCAYGVDNFMTYQRLEEEIAISTEMNQLCGYVLT